MRAAALALVVAVGTTGCTDIEDALSKVPFLAFMKSSPAFDPYEAPRPAPAGSIPVRDPFGVAPYAQGNTQADLIDLAARATNPFAGDTAALAGGRIHFERHCSVCHGPQGAGDGMILGPGRFPFAPSLVSPTVAGNSDGYIYAVVRQGRGLMPAYGPRMTEAERWQVVNYVRSLAAASAPGAAPAPAQASASAAPAQGDTATPPR
ncbi:MAG TPA: cytochrome c [Longimicrobiales bacterium]|nr:cytochrome c [Longimicrobiales bacterium]